MSPAAPSPGDTRGSPVPAAAGPGRAEPGRPRAASCPSPPADDLADEMEDVDFDDEGADEPDAEAWETEEDEGVEDGMEAQDDSEVTFSLHSGECWLQAAAAGVSPEPAPGLVRGCSRYLLGCRLPASSGTAIAAQSCLGPGLFLPHTLVKGLLSLLPQQLAPSAADSLCRSSPAGRIDSCWSGL